MEKTIVSQNEIKLVGLSVVTNNTNEQNPKLAKIALLLGQYFSNNIPNLIQHRTKPGITFSVYTNYESDEHGEYTYFLGEEVSSLDNLPPTLKSMIIPASQYQRFTTNPGKMPQVVIEAWQAIWQMTSEQLGGQRRYLADFEIYDERASDPSNTALDIYIGIK